MSYSVVKVSLSLLMALLLCVGPYTPVALAQKRPVRASSKPKTVQINIHSDYKETYDLKKSAPAETMTAHAEMAITHEFSQKMQWVGYENAPGGLLPVEGSPGATTGTFNYKSEDDLKGSNGHGDHHVVQVAGSLDPAASTASVQMGEGDSEVIVDSSSANKLAACQTSGDLKEDPKQCGPSYMPDEIDLHSGECNGTCAFLTWGYELHPESDRPSEDPGYWAEKQWYGSVTTGSAGSFQITFNGLKKFDRPSDDQYVKEDHHEKVLKVTIKISPAGAVGANRPTLRWMNSEAFAAFAISDPPKNRHSSVER